MILKLKPDSCAVFIQLGTTVLNPTNVRFGRFWRTDKAVFGRCFEVLSTFSFSLVSHVEPAQQLFTFEQNMDDLLL